MSKIIFFSHVKLYVKGKTFGPAVRLMGIADALLKAGHEVEIAEKDSEKKGKLDSIDIVPWSRAVEDIEGYDAAYIPIWLNDREFLEQVSKIPLAVDVYAPYMVEHIYHIYNNKSAKNIRKFKNDVLTPSLSPLFYGDHFLVANERQKRFYLGMLTAIGRITPLTDDELISIVPYAVPSKKTRTSKPYLNAKPELKGKKIILWFGTLFPWYDPKTAVDTFRTIKKTHKDYALVFLGGKNPRAPQYLLNRTYEDAVGYVKKGEDIYFYDWVELEKLPAILKECEFALLTYKKSYETELSHRTRVLDLLGGELPVLCTQGDFLSKEIEKFGLGITFPAENPRLTAKAISMLIEDDVLKDTFRQNIRKYNKGKDWNGSISELKKFFKAPKKDKEKSRSSVYHIIEDNRMEIKHLKRYADEKAGNARDFHKGIRDREKMLQESNRTVSELQSEMIRKDMEIQNMHEKSERQVNYINRFQNSITYPLYVAVSRFGRTGLGRMLRKLLK